MSTGSWRRRGPASSASTWPGCARRAWPPVRWPTARRLHGHERRYRGGYEAVLAGWAGWLAAQRGGARRALVYLDNTMVADHALRDARALGATLGAGVAPSDA